MTGHHYDQYVYAITALLPLSASMVVFQANPYHALVIRGILGAIAALVYTVLGAADVALTEALVGTMLAVTLNVIAVRSSMVLRVGVLKDEAIGLGKNDEEVEFEAYMDPVAVPVTKPPSSQVNPELQVLLNDLRTTFRKHHLRLELVPYPYTEDLHRGLIEKEIHVTCTRLEDGLISQLQADPLPGNSPLPYRATTRLQRIYEILQTELTSSPAIAYLGALNTGEKAL